MRARARLGSHPMHPMVVPIPIGAFTVALVADIALFLGADEAWQHTARWTILIGLVAAAIAAVLGLIDYVGVRMSSRGRRLATYHLMLNLVVVGLYAVSYWLRVVDARGAWGTAAFLSTVGFLLLGVSGWIGGEMVYRHKLAVVEQADPEATEIGQREPA